jgi:hypothetical protein
MRSTAWALRAKYRVVSQPIVASMGKVIKATENHFQRNISEGAVQGFSNSVSQVDQEGIQEPGGQTCNWIPLMEAAWK